MGLGLVLFLLIVLLPSPFGPPERDVTRDVYRLRQAECRYRGIPATFQDATQAYLLETYTEGEVLRWEGRPSPHNPDTETLVTAWCRVGAAKPVLDPVVPDSIRQLRRQAGSRIPVTWSYNTLAKVRIDAVNDFARDAIAVFRMTVDRFIRSMVLTDRPVTLRAAAALAAAPVYQVDSGIVLLRESPPDSLPGAPGWTHVRVPATRHRGWVLTEKLTKIEDDR